MSDWMTNFITPIPPLLGVSTKLISGHTREDLCLERKIEVNGSKQGWESTEYKIPWSPPPINTRIIL